MTVKQLIDELMKIPNQEKQVVIATPFELEIRWVDCSPVVRDIENGVIIE